MKNNYLVLWICSFVITFLTIFLANLLNKDYPISGTFGIESKKVSYRFEKTHFGNDDIEIIIRNDVENVKGKLLWKFIFDKEWNVLELRDSTSILSGSIPNQKPLKSIEYYIELNHNDKKYLLPDNQKVNLTFYGKISPMLNVLEYLLLYLGLFLAIRTGLEYFNSSEKRKIFAVLSGIIFLTLTLLINPLYLTYKLGYMNKTIPAISNLFPYGLVLMTVLWILTILVLFRYRKLKITSAVAGIITVIIFCFMI